MARKITETAETAETGETKITETAETAETGALVKMFRPVEFAGNGPTVADVDPSEVANYKLGGWQEAE